MKTIGLIGGTAWFLLLNTIDWSTKKQTNAI